MDQALAAQRARLGGRQELAARLIVGLREKGFDGHGGSG
jgi:hypothetical protein